MEDNYLSLDEVATLLGVHKDTVRRKIKRGELKATLLPGPYGEQYFIKQDDLQIPQQIVDVVTVPRQLSVEDLSKLLAMEIQRQNEPLVNAVQIMQKQIETLQQELTAAKGEVVATREQLKKEAEERDQRLIESMRTLMQARKPWYKKILGG